MRVRRSNDIMELHADHEAIFINLVGSKEESVLVPAGKFWVRSLGPILVFLSYLCSKILERVVPRCNVQTHGRSGDSMYRVAHHWLEARRKGWELYAGCYHLFRTIVICGQLHCDCLHKHAIYMHLHALYYCSERDDVWSSVVPENSNLYRYQKTLPIQFWAEASRTSCVTEAPRWRKLAVLGCALCTFDDRRIHCRRAGKPWLWGLGKRTESRM